MRKIYTNYCKTFFVFVISLASFNFSYAQPIDNFDENMDEGLITPGWSASNRSQNRNTGLTGGWLLGQAGSVSSFGVSAYNGPDTSYIFSYFGVIASGKSGTISTWLLTPELNLANGAVFKFWSRSALDGGTDEYPDRMEVRMSTNGASTNLGPNVGPIWNTVGDFTNLLLTINPDIDLGVYPQEWTEYTVTISGLAAATTGRLAFRYFVTDGGPAGSNSLLVGIDQVSYDVTGTVPVSLINFDGQLKNNSVQLNWKTSSEINNKGFDVERSIDGKNFSAIGFVAGKGSSAIENAYTYNDFTKQSGTVYYRLNQKDNDGKSKLSNVIKLTIDNDFTWQVYPNPLADNSAIQIQLPQQSKVSVQVVSMDGKLLRSIDKGTLNQGTYTIPLNMISAAKGSYLVKLVVDGKTFTKTIIK